jgi:hypothetical protein
MGSVFAAIHSGHRVDDPGNEFFAQGGLAILVAPVPVGAFLEARGGVDHWVTPRRGLIVSMHDVWVPGRNLVALELGIVFR